MYAKFQSSFAELPFQVESDNFGIRAILYFLWASPFGHMTVPVMKPKAWLQVSCGKCGHENAIYLFPEAWVWPSFSCVTPHNSQRSQTVFPAEFLALSKRHTSLESTAALGQLPNISRKLIDRLDEASNFRAPVWTRSTESARGSWVVISKLTSSLTVLPACLSAGWESWEMALDMLSCWFFRCILVSSDLPPSLEKHIQSKSRQIGSHQAF